LITQWVGERVERPEVILAPVMVFLLKDTKHGHQRNYLTV